MRESSSSFRNFSSLDCMQIKGVSLESIPTINLDDQGKSESIASCTYTLAEDIILFFDPKNFYALYTNVFDNVHL